MRSEYADKYCFTFTIRIDRSPAFKNAGAWAMALANSVTMELDMGRRKELKGVCNDLLDNFVSRYNDLDGYWALGKFKTFLESTQNSCLSFDLTHSGSDHGPFSQTLDYYCFAFRRQLKIKKIPVAHVASAIIKVEQQSPAALICSFKITTDHGKVYECRKQLMVRRHDPSIELRRAGQHGPQNQRGV